jgi:hypothetical protein
MQYAVVYFTLAIMDAQDGFVGKHNVLRLVEHSSAAIVNGAAPGGVWGSERVVHRLPANGDMQFWRHFSWSSRQYSSALASASSSSNSAVVGMSDDGMTVTVTPFVPSTLCDNHFKSVLRAIKALA